MHACDDPLCEAFSRGYQKGLEEARSRIHGSCQEHGCQWPQGLGQMIVAHDRYKLALEKLDHKVHPGWRQAIIDIALRPYPGPPISDDSFMPNR